ncbi:MAG TPA: thioredoxin domain-containing protein [Acidisarcina sp.]
MHFSAVSARVARSSTLPVILAGFIFLATAVAQFSNPRPEPTPDRSVVRPPAGFRVAIVEFEDLECPQCARANPILKAASANYHAPWIRHDFPLAQHIWSHQAAINARWFDTKSKKLGDDYRDAVFADQINIENLDGLRDFTEKFAKEHGNIAMPFAVDPQGKLDALVMADAALGQRMGIDETPTIWVVTYNPAISPVRVRDLTSVYTTLDQAFAQTKASAKPVVKPVSHVVKH